MGADLVAKMTVPEWDVLESVRFLLSGAPGGGRPAVEPTEVPAGEEPDELSTSALPDWTTLDRLAKILNFTLEPTREKPCPIDLNRVYVVRFLNQTANKPLHLGHLRNAALGTAAAGCAEAMGGRVVRQCVVEDTGRFMSEAMAAVADLERSGGRAKPGPGEKGDVFMGRRYVAYRKAITAHLPGGPTASTGYDARNDAADELQRGLSRHDEEALRLWSAVRDLTLGGQDQTLRALGYGFDFVDYESSEDQHVVDFVERGLERGVFTENDRGEIVFPRGSARAVTLVNSVGLYEESSRLLSLIYRLLTGGAYAAIHVVVAGAEWRGSMRSYPAMMTRLGIEGHEASYAQAFYGMITKDGRKMSSSDGTGVLVDAFLADLASHPAVAEIAASGGGAQPLHLAASILKTFLLSAHRADPIEFDAGLLNDPEANPGYVLLRAWVTAGGEGPVPGKPSDRCLGILRDALARVSFERLVGEAAGLAAQVLVGSAEPQTVADFRILMEAAGLVPRGSTFAFASTPNLAGLDEADLLVR